MGLNLNKFPYKNMRDVQKEILDKLQANWNNYRFFVIEAPPGIRLL